MSKLREAEPASVARCPKCGSEDVTARCDAYANYVLQGFDAEGFPVLSQEQDVQTFDERTYICEDCSYENSQVREFRLNSENQQGRPEPGRAAPS